MKLPCCLVDEKGHKLVAQRHHAPEAAAAARRGATAPSCGRNRSRNSVLGLALLLTSVFTDLCPMQPTNAVSKSITPPCRSSALQQFASFLELEECASKQEDEAEEQAMYRLYHANPARRWPPSSSSPWSSGHGTTATPAAVPQHQEAVSRQRTGAPQLRVGLIKTLETTGSFFRPVVAPPTFHPVVDRSSTPFSAPSSFNGESVSADSMSTTSSSSSYDEPTAARTFAGSALRKSTVLNGNRVSCDSSNPQAFSDCVPRFGGVPAARWSSTAIASQAPLWHQRDVLDLAMETHSSSFVALTQHMIACGLFRTVYTCYLDTIGDPPYRTTAVEVTQLTTLDRSEAPCSVQACGQGRPPPPWPWTCPSCAKKHRQVREGCVRCGAPAANVSKLFVGQLRKEALCDDVLWKLVVATAPDVIPLRVEGHCWTGNIAAQFPNNVEPHHRGASPLFHSPAVTNASTGRGKGCGSVYVRPAEAARLVPLLHRNVFLDADFVDPTREMFFFAYAEQQLWMEQFAAARVHSWGSSRPRTLPQRLVVCECAAH